MKKSFCLMLIVMFFVAGCSSSGIKVNPTQRDKLLLSAIASDVPGALNIKVLAVKEFRGQIVAAYSYYYADTQYCNYGTFELSNKKMKLLSKGGGVGKTKANQLLTVSSGGAIDPDPYLITYGEIFDSKIKSIKIEYIDSSTATEQLSSSGYLIIREGISGGIKCLEALDKESKVVYRIP